MRSTTTSKTGWRLTRGFVAVCIALASLAGGVFLFLCHDLSDGAFVSFIALGLVVSFIIARWTQLSELSLLGNSVKLSKLTKEAEDAIASLEHGRVNLYRVAMNLCMRQPSLYASPYGDDRLREFLPLIETIRKEGLFAELSKEICKHSKLLKDRQYKQLSSSRHQVQTRIDLSEVTPEDLPVRFYDWFNQEEGAKANNDNPDQVSEMKDEVDRLKEIMQINRDAEQAVAQ